MRPRCMLLITAFMLGLAGCANDPLATSSWPEARPLGERLAAYRADPEPPRDPKGRVMEAAEPESGIQLRDAYAAALMRNPELARFSYDVRAAEARAIQAGRWDNPELELEIENFGGSGELEGFDAPEITLGLSQTFPLGGDVQRRQQLARLEGQLAGWDYEAARIALLAEVTQRYVDVLVAQRQVEIAERALALTGQLAESITRRVEAGDAPAVEGSRVLVPVASAEIDLLKAERALETSRVRLAMTWGSTGPRFTQLAGDLNHLPSVPSAEELQQAIDQSPEVARWAVEIASRQAEVELARAEAVPDLTAGLGFRWFNETDDAALVAGLSIPLPVLDRREGDILAARFGIASAAEQQRAIQLQVNAALATAYARLVNARDEVAALRDRALPPAEAAHQDVRRAFDEGNLGYLDVLDAERTLIELRQQHLDALAEFHGAAADIEGLLGLPLSSFHSTDPTP